jgi:hypothetical protein
MPLNITEYSSLIGNAIAVTPKLAGADLAIGGVSAAYGPFSLQTVVVRLQPDAICRVAFSLTAGVAPTAGAGDARMVAGQTEYFSVKPGDFLAVIASS